MLVVQPGQELADGSDPGAGALTGRAWLAALPGELAPQRRVMAGLIDRCEAWATPLATTEALVAAALPELGTLVDVLRHQTGPAGQVRRIFAQFADGTQLDLAVVPESEIEARRRRGGAPDFVALYRAPGWSGMREPDDRPPADGGEPAAAYAVTGDQVRQWAFQGWVALIDADKYLRRGSLWEAHGRLHEARERIWALWAAAHGAMYPWHGLSQVLDHDPRSLPPGIEGTVAGLDAADLRRAARAAAQVLATVSEAAGRRHPADLPAPMAAHVTRALSREP
jgi:hypothetical protein